MLGLSGGEADEERSECGRQESDGAHASQVPHHWRNSFDEWIIQLDQTGAKSFVLVVYIEENWLQAVENNNENLVIANSKSLVRQFQEEFNKLWSENQLYSSPVRESSCVVSGDIWY